MPENSIFLGERRIVRAVAAGSVILAIVAGCGDGDVSARTQNSSRQTELTTGNEVHKYAEHAVRASVYGVGEDADASNDYISNFPSAWSSDSVRDFGGVDPLQRRRDFTSLHNTYYFALPAAEFDENGLIPGAREKSPWAAESSRLSKEQSLFKGRWIRVQSGEKKIYAQWHDVGPNEEADYAYVFGNGSVKPVNTFGVKAGLDLSPDAAHALGFGLDEGFQQVVWSFVDESDVPDGPWREYPPIDNNTRW